MSNADGISSIPITAGPPQPGVIAYVNAATSASGPLAPGELFTIYGTSLGPKVPVYASASGGHLPTQLGGVQVFLAGIACPLLYVSSTQINAIVPFQVSGQTASLVVSYSGLQTQSDAQWLGVASTAPGILTQDSSGQGPGTVLNDDGSLNRANNPCTTGSAISIYATGLGEVTNQPATGQIAASSPLSDTKATPAVTIGGLAAKVLFSGLAPGFVGVYQVNVQVPNAVLNWKCHPDGYVGRRSHF